MSFSQGEYCVIENDVIVGDNVTLGHHVILKSGTVIGDNVTIADGVMTTGPCTIYDDVNIRTGAIIAKGVVIGDGCFIGPMVCTYHTKYPGWSTPIPTVIARDCVIGGGSQIGAGLHLAERTWLGMGSVLTKDITENDQLWYGNPAKYRGPAPR